MYHALQVLTIVPQGPIIRHLSIVNICDTLEETVITSCYRKYFGIVHVKYDSWAFLSIKKGKL